MDIFDLAKGLPKGKKVSKVTSLKKVCMNCYSQVNNQKQNNSVSIAEMCFLLMLKQLTRKIQEDH